MAAATKPQSQPPQPIFWWRPWMMALGCILLLLLCLASESYAQAERKRPARADATGKSGEQVPTRESTSGAESPRNLEENLRLLLRLDSLQSARRKVAAGAETSELVMDQSITKPGRDFYDLFYSQWEAPADVKEYTIIIGEKPGRANSTFVTVRVNDNDLLEFPLQPNYDIIQETAREAIGYVQDYLVQQLNLSRQLERGERVSTELY
ncbi:curli production assembly/transport component CsgE [Hymenobacter luteus]|uniref:Curli production assembly/transport component CsgE n=2 Tax=Hymenobacter TaxID=89966 RepID=A0A7W9T3Z8_9BACT|nr:MULTISPECIES: CsgE family curli-type amyloid fiber assembly protein [Hymenobacter]MBB4603025.1 curli production assembly/transport component CsgE [Hymenobacter latericoloratus]MBB6061016.1 curli production assembly/transport component CsgE [Hymenobacter luteus]